MIEIDETKLPESLFVTDKDGKKTIDLNKIKTVEDVSSVLTAKEHVKTELAQLKEKYKDVDLEKYKKLTAIDPEKSKEVTESEVYKNLELKFNQLNQITENYKKEIANRDQEIIDSKLKEEIRKFQDIAPTAVEDLFYRAKSSGIKLTEAGFLSKEGKDLASFLNDQKTLAPHLFKRSVGEGVLSKEQLEKIAAGKKSKSVKDVIGSYTWLK